MFVAGCKRPAQPVAPLKPTAAGAALVETSGGHQLGATGTALKDPLVVQVNDDQGTAVGGALVEFHGPSGVIFEPAAVLTDSSGQATTAVTPGYGCGTIPIERGYSWKVEAGDALNRGDGARLSAETGSILNARYCSGCHDPESSHEQVSNFDNLEAKPHAFAEGATSNKMSDADLEAIIQHGVPALNRSALMPRY
jgi:hypothetical protein